MDYLQDESETTCTTLPPTQSTTSTIPPLPPAYESNPYNGMPPPPTTAYPDLPSLMRACQDHGRRHGYACVTSSNNYKRGIAYVRCDRGGEYVNHWKVTDQNRVRKNRTRRLVGCKWKARAKRNAEGQWVLSMMHDKHTGHDPSKNLAAHPSLRQLPHEAVDAARRAFAASKSPKEVLDLLQHGWNDAVTAQDVYNLKAKIVRTSEGGKGTPGNSAVRVGPSLPVDPPMDPALNDDLSMNGQLVNSGSAQVARMQAPGEGLGSMEDPVEVSEAPAARKCECTCCDH